MKSEFRFVRQGLSSPYDVTVRLEAIPSDRFSVNLLPHLRADLSGHMAVLFGVRSAFESAMPETALAVTVTNIIDHSGSTGDLGYKICGEAAMYHLLGLPDRVPFPGFVRT